MAADRNNTNKTITRLLQHSILQLCNEHIGYSHKLQILGVLCMTVDDEQQELVVKVNNTLKRVNPAAPKEVAQLPPSTANITSIQPTAAAVAAPTAALIKEDQHSNSPSPVNGNGRRTHGRKGTNPVKVQQVYDDAALPSDMDEDDAVTVIPEAPEATLGYMSPQRADSPPVDGDSDDAASTTPRPRMTSILTDKISGSAKRKAQLKVPTYTPSPTSPYVVQYRSINTEEFEGEGNASASQGTTTGLTLPVFVANKVSTSGGTNETAEGSSDETPQVNGEHEPDESLNLSTSSQETGNESNINESPLVIKAEPKDDENEAMDLSRDATPRSEATLPEGGVFNIVPTSGLHEFSALTAQLSYSGLGLLARQADNSSADGLTIKYTTTGPYTVGANGKDVSNSSRIKDIIMYDEQSPLNQQKGSRIETDFIVDKLGMDGRKRRRRATEDQLTPEEIAEYLGHDNETYQFQCKYCPDEFDSVTRYLHHSIAVHQAYICHQCGKSFTTKSSLLRHRPIHTGMRRFACSICRKTFYRKDKCKAHIKRHLGGGKDDGSPAKHDLNESSLVIPEALGDNIPQIEVPSFLEGISENLAPIKVPSLPEAPISSSPSPLPVV